MACMRTLAVAAILPSLWPPPVPPHRRRRSPLRSSACGAFRTNRPAARWLGCPNPPADGWDGFAIYTSDGFVSINMMPKGRKWKLKTATLKELRRTLEDGSAYVGRYKVDPRLAP